MGRPREEVIPARRERLPPGPPLVSLAQLRHEHPWWWLRCSNPACGRMVPVAIVPLIIRLGPLFPVEDLLRHAKCGDCRHRGAALSMRSYADIVTGYAPWPRHFITDERGTAVEPNRQTHYHGGRPMEWWIKKQALPELRKPAAVEDSLNRQENIMADDKTETRVSDDELINLNDDQIGAWADKIGVSAIELQAAVEKVGPRVEDVRRFLRK